MMDKVFTYLVNEPAHEIMVTQNLRLEVLIVGTLPHSLIK